MVASSVRGLTTTCNINLQKFPFDTQTCEILIQTGVLNDYIGLTLSKSDLNLDMSGFGDRNTEWMNVTMSYVIEHLSYYDNNPEWQLDQVTITITLVRNPVFYVIYLVIPSVLMAFVSVLVFLLPPESGERVGLIITVMLSCTVFILMVSDMTPRGGENTSLLGRSLWL